MNEEPTTYPNTMGVVSTDKNGDSYRCGFCAWLVATILLNGFFFLLLLIPLPYDPRTTCSVELVGFNGLQQAMASPAATGPTTSSPAFDLLVHVNNGHRINLTHDGGDVVVSYAGVPLARGRTPSFEMATMETAVLPVKATSAGVGLPEDLFRLMTEERRWGVAQLRIEFGLAWDSFTCNVELDGQPRMSECYKLTLVDY